MLLILIPASIVLTIFIVFSIATPWEERCTEAIKALIEQVVIANGLWIANIREPSLTAGFLRCGTTETVFRYELVDENNERSIWLVHFSHLRNPFGSKNLNPKSVRFEQI